MTFGIVASSHPLSSFSPSDVSGLAAWWDATAITGLSNGDPVSTWDDLAGSNDLVNETNAPGYLTSGIDSKAAVQFATNESMAVTAAAGNQPNLGGAFAIAAVVQFDSTSGIQMIVSKSAAQYEMYLDSGKASSIVQGSVIAQTAPGSLSSTSVPYLLTLTRNASNAIKLRVDASEVASGSDSDTNTGTYRMRMGRRADSSSFYLSARVGEVLIYNQDVSTPDLANIESYLAGKWGVSI